MAVNMNTYKRVSAKKGRDDIFSAMLHDGSFAAMMISRGCMLSVMALTAFGVSLIVNIFRGNYIYDIVMSIFESLAVWAAVSGLQGIDISNISNEFLFTQSKT